MAGEGYRFWLETPTRAHGLHPGARLRPLAVCAAEVTVGRGTLALETQSGEPLAALFAPETPFFHRVLLSAQPCRCCYAVVE